MAGRLCTSSAARACTSLATAELRKHYDCIVIGGGVIGCSVAYHAARAGASVLVVERREIAAEQSSKSWGFCRQQGRDTRELPLMKESIGRWTNLEEELGATVGWQQGGNLMLFENEAAALVQSRWAEAARPFGVHTEVLDRAGVAAIVPSLSDTIVGGLWTPSDGTANPEDTTRAFAVAAERHGAHFALGQSVVALESGNPPGSARRIAGVQLSGGQSIRATSTVLATAGWASDMLRSHGLNFPTLRLHATAGTASVVEPMTATFPSAGVWAKRCSFRMRPDGHLTIADGGFREEHDVGWETLLNGPRFLPALTHFWRQTNLRLRRNSFPRPRPDACPAPNSARLASAVREFSHLFPAAPPLKIERSWAGFIDVTPDMVPVMDSDALKGLTIMAGFSGHGLGIAPGVGRLGAAMAMDQPGARQEAYDFRLGRFSDSWWVGPQSLV